MTTEVAGQALSGEEGAQDIGSAPVPRYGAGALSDLLPAVLASLGVSGEPDVLGLEPTRRACVLLIDGLGDDQLREHPDVAPFLAGWATRGVPAARVLSAGFPATTAVSLASLGTGLPPGRHGLVGYQVRVPGEGWLMNSLRWDERIDPRAWQPRRTAFERAAAAGVTVSQVSSGLFEGGGLTVAALRGGTYVAAESVGERVSSAAQAAAAGDRSLVYVYYGDLDATGHRRGCHSQAWRLQLAHTDRMVEQLAAALPAGTMLYVTADHGMVDVPSRRRWDFDGEPALREGVVLLGGEARARYLYTAAGAAAAVARRWRRTLGEAFWVGERAAAVTAGWFGPEVDAEVGARIGDVLAVARSDAAVVATQAEPMESRLVGMHGGLTPAEQRVPLLAVPV